MIVTIIAVLVTVALLICCILAYKNKEKDRVQAVILTIVTAIVGAGAILTSFPSTVEVVFPEYRELLDENDGLKGENEKLKQQIVNKDAELAEKNDEVKELKQSLKNNATFLEYGVYYKDNKLAVNINDAVAQINGQLYFSQTVLENLVDEEVSKDSSNKILYLGKYPEKVFELLQICEPYDPDDGFRLGKEHPFKIQSNTYAEGFSLDAHCRYVRSVRFNLDNKYSELLFNMGHVDETSDGGTFTLTFLVDGEEVKKIVQSIKDDIDKEQSVPLNYGKTLEIEWICDDESWNTTYGLVDIKVK